MQLREEGSAPCPTIQRRTHHHLCAFVLYFQPRGLPYVMHGATCVPRCCAFLSLLLPALWLSSLFFLPPLRAAGLLCFPLPSSAADSRSFYSKGNARGRGAPTAELCRSRAGVEEEEDAEDAPPPSLSLFPPPSLFGSGRFPSLSPSLHFPILAEGAGRCLQVVFFPSPPHTHTLRFLPLC